MLTQSLANPGLPAIWLHTYPIASGVDSTSCVDRRRLLHNTLKISVCLVTLGHKCHGDRCDQLWL